MNPAPFSLEASSRVDSLGLELRQYRHRATGARHYHLACADDNNAFMVALPTLPEDSTGVAHILEHTTLCGSERYPVRDPFFLMLRRSLNTFMNAFTSGDSTAYPFATQNRKDFDNLLGVYLDAVFFPTLNPLDFAQEGWRLEAAADGSLEYHGVVYNEMKGAMSAPLSQLYQHVHAALLPDTVYRHNSGGDPLVIPALSYAALKAFHARHYHPGNAVFMTYGSFDEREHQARMEERVLARFAAPAATLVSALQPRFDAPRTVEVTYHVEEVGERQTHIVWGWLLGESADVGAAIDAHVLSALLLEHGASPLRHLLESTELADAPSELCGVDDSARQLVFLCGVEGSEVAHATALGQAIVALLEAVARDGVDHATLGAIVDRLELAQRDIDGGSYPFGLQLMSRILPAALYRRDPAALLDLEPEIARLRQEVTTAGYVTRLVRRALLDNSHRVRVVMRPDPGKAAAELQVERQRLAQLAAGLDEHGRARLAAAAAALQARQAEVDDVDKLPRVTLADVPAAGAAPRPAPAAAADVQAYACAANGVFRARLVCELPALPPDVLGFLPLFADYLTELGHGDADYLAVQERRARLGNFDADLVYRADPRDGVTPRAFLVLAAKGLARKRDALVDTIGELLAGVRFDEHERLAELLLQSRAEAEQSVADRGHQLAVMCAARSLGDAAALDELWDGASAVRALKALVAEESGAERLAAGFATLRRLIAAAPRRFLLIGDAPELEGAVARAGRWCEADVAPAAPFAAALPPVPQGPRGWLANAQVNFCAKAYCAVAEADADAPALAVLGRYLQDGYLHGAIRERGGAYGSGAGYDADSATFRFFSYRDPRAAETLADFDRALDWFDGQSDQRRLEESILGTIRALDQPRSPAGTCERAFHDALLGRDDAFRARFREQVLATDHADLRRVAERHLEPGSGMIGVISSPAAAGEFAALGIDCERL